MHRTHGHHKRLEAKRKFFDSLLSIKPFSVDNILKDGLCPIHYLLQFCTKLTSVGRVGDSVVFH